MMGKTGTLPLKIMWKSHDSTSVIDLERRLTEYLTLNSFDKCIYSIERFATSVPLIKKALYFNTLL